VAGQLHKPAKGFVEGLLSKYEAGSTEQLFQSVDCFAVATPPAPSSPGTIHTVSMDSDIIVIDDAPAPARSRQRKPRKAKEQPIVLDSDSAEDSDTQKQQKRQKAAQKRKRKSQDSDAAVAENMPSKQQRKQKQKKQPEEKRTDAAGRTVRCLLLLDGMSDIASLPKDACCVYPLQGTISIQHPHAT